MQLHEAWLGCCCAAFMSLHPSWGGSFVTHTPVSNPFPVLSKLCGSPTWAWVESFVWDEETLVHIIPEEIIKRPFFPIVSFFGP